MIYLLNYSHGGVRVETVTGLSNWKLTIKRNENEITILRAVTCDKDAILPDELFSLPVTVIADRALAPTAKPLAGEEVTVICGMPDGEWDNRNITSLVLPRHLRRADNYAFMNCSSLRSVELHDELNELSFTSFMNCRLLKSFTLYRESEKQGPVLADIVSWYPRELEFTVRETNGEVLSLVFPEYYEIYSEKGGTLFYDYNIEGAGYAYHNMFKNRCFSVSDYDRLWSNYLTMDYDRGTALRLAWGRLSAPVGLTDEAKSDYESYLFAHAREGFDLAFSTKDTELIRTLLKAPALSAEDREYALNTAREKHMTEITAIMLEHQHQSRGSARRRSFEL